MNRKKKILILGGEGFIGRNLADLLSKKYACFSIGLKKSIFKKRKDKFIKADPYEKKIKNDYDVIIHLIDNKIDLKHFSEEEKKLIKNIGLNQKNHLIIFSSAVVYANPDSEYGQRKLKLEKIYSEYCKKNKIKLTIFRLFNTYGLYQIPNRQGSLIANLLMNYLNNKTTEINDKLAQRDFIFSQDIGKFIHYAIKNSTVGTFDLATNNLISIEKIIKILEKKVIKKKISIIYKNDKESAICPKSKNNLLKNIKITKLDTGFKKAFIFYEKNMNIINKLK